MKNYTIEMMNNKGYNNYMGGGNEYRVETTIICANNEAEAIEIAKRTNPKMHINTNYVKPTETIYPDYEIREQAKKQAKAEKEAEKAKANGMTIEEYKAYKKEQAKITRYKREVREMKEAIAEMERKIKYRENYINKEK